MVGPSQWIIPFIAHHKLNKSFLVWNSDIESIQTIQRAVLYTSRLCVRVHSRRLISCHNPCKEKVYFYTRESKKSKVSNFCYCQFTISWCRTQQCSFLVKRNVSSPLSTVVLLTSKLSANTSTDEVGLILYLHQEYLYHQVQSVYIFDYLDKFLSFT